MALVHAELAAFDEEGTAPKQGSQRPEQNQDAKASPPPKGEQNALEESEENAGGETFRVNGGNNERATSHTHSSRCSEWSSTTGHTLVSGILTSL